MEKNEIVFKILGFGDSGVGQTCIFKRYIENKFLKNIWQQQDLITK